MSHFPPPPQMPPKAGLFRRVPPAIFASILGLLGLITTWMRAVHVFGFPIWIVEVAAGMVTLLFLFSIAAYGVKFMLRPGSWVEDLGTLPGRTGVAALFVGLMVLAAILAPKSETLAIASLFAGVAGLFAVASFVLPQRLSGTDPSGPMTPAMHLVFVGFILIPGAALALDMGVSAVPWVIWYCLVAATIITLRSIRPLLTGELAPVLRPLQVIHLAPPAFIASGAMATGQSVLGALALGWSTLLVGVLLARLRWMIQGDFTAFWSAFTFPLTAYAGALMQGYVTFGWPVMKLGAGIVIVAITLYIPAIAFKVLKLWAEGALAAKTNASTA